MKRLLRAGLVCFLILAALVGLEGWYGRSWLDPGRGGEERGGERPAPEPPPPLAVVYHSHTHEAYLPALFPDEAERARQDPNEAAFSADHEKTVVRVGARLVAELERAGVPTLHLATVHDPGGRSGREGAYRRSLRTLRLVARRYPSVRLWIDVHRDATSVRVPVKGRPAAGILLVVGQNHPDWHKNQAVAQRLAGRIKETYPGLSRGVRLLPRGRFNQHMSPCVILLEVGGVENNMEEALYSAGLVAPLLVELLDSCPAGG